MQTYFTLNEHILRRRQEAAATWRAAFASPAPGGPGSAFALGASGERQRPEGVLSEPPGLRPLRMSSLHALGSRVRGPTGCAASDAALPVPDWATEATAAAAAAAAGLRTAAQQAAPLGHAAAQADYESASRALAKARSLLRLARDVEAGARPSSDALAAVNAPRCTAVPFGNPRPPLRRTDRATSTSAALLLLKRPTRPPRSLR